MSPTPPPTGSEPLGDELAELTPEASWQRDGEAWTCTVPHGMVVVAPGANGGWQVDRLRDGEVVDRRVVHGGLDGSAAEQIADVVLGWGG